MVWVPLVLMVLGLAWAFVGPRLKLSYEIDSCLDLGGSFDHSTRSCTRLSNDGSE